MYRVMVRALDSQLKRLQVRVSIIPLSGNNLGQVVHTHVTFSPRSIIWYHSKGGDALRLGRPFVTDFSGLSTYGLTAWGREMSTPLTLLMGYDTPCTLCHVYAQHGNHFLCRRDSCEPNEVSNGRGNGRARCWTAFTGGTLAFTTFQHWITVPVISPTLLCLQYFGWASEGHLAYKNLAMKCWHGYLCGTRCILFAYGYRDYWLTVNHKVV